MTARPPVAPYLTVSPAAGAIAFYTAAFDAKQPSLSFSADSQGKRESADAALRAAIERWAGEPYARLERLRLRDA